LSDFTVHEVIVTESEFTIEQDIFFDTVTITGTYSTIMPQSARFLGKIFIGGADCSDSSNFDQISKSLTYIPVGGDYLPNVGDQVIVCYCRAVPISLSPLESPGLQSYKAAPNALPSTIAAGASWNSGLILSGGYTKIAVGLTTDQDTSVFVPRYIDQAGLVPEPNDPQQLALVATVPGVINILDGIPFGGFNIRLNNTGANPTIPSNLVILLSS